MLLVALLVQLLSAAPEVDEPPDAFAHRSPLPSCGEVDAGLWAPSGPEVECLERALRNGAAAELVVGTVTDEGDPVVFFYRSVPGSPGLEIFVDAREDAFGSRAWEHLTCPEATAVSDLGTCSED